MTSSNALENVFQIGAGLDVVELGGRDELSDETACRSAPPP